MASTFRKINEMVSRFIIDQSFIGRKHSDETGTRLSDYLYGAW